MSAENPDNVGEQGTARRSDPRPKELLVVLTGRLASSPDAEIRGLAARLAVTVLGRATNDSKRSVTLNAIIDRTGRDPHYSVRNAVTR